MEDIILKDNKWKVLDPIEYSLNIIKCNELIYVLLARFPQQIEEI
jgi:hypothetical protein